MEKLTPLKFKTIYKEKLWGGKKIKTILGKDYGNLENCGETWELSGVDGDVSVVSGGSFEGTPLTELLSSFRELLVGERVYERFGNEFPLLIKFIDANQDLSVQVHPDDELAAKRGVGFGKTEMWYMIQADEGAKLINGFSQDLDKRSYLDAFESGRLMEVLNQEEVRPDDAFFIPAGRVHTIGKGCFLAEIQQTSDTTYRIYDFDRKDKSGNMRELHVAEALDAIDFTTFDTYVTRVPVKKNEVSELVACTYFTTNRIAFNSEISRDFSQKDTFVIYIGIEGEMQLRGQGFEITVSKGEVVLIPASCREWSLHPNPDAKCLETFIT